MHTKQPHLPPELADMEEAPWRYSFLQLCRWLDAQSAPHPPLGTAPLPRHEMLRLGQSPSTAFATREIAEIFHTGGGEHGQMHVRLLGLGLWGPGGPLPLHLTEEAHERALVLRDTTLIDFLNIFHHRALSLFYRAWCMGQSTVGLDRPKEERFSFYVSCLSGQELPESTLTGYAAPPPHARLSAVGHLTRRSRNPMGLVATLEHYFGVTVRLEEYCFHWLTLEPEAHCRLGHAHAPCRLAQDAVLGGHVPDRQCRFALHIGPLDVRQYCRFLPGEPYAQALLRWVREFIGVELAFRVHLSLLPQAVPPCTLGGAARLGRTTWLGRCRGPQAVKGVVFGP